MFSKQDILLYGTRLIVILLINPIHEFAHAWSADKLGDPTARYKGRLTLNPLAHIDPIGSILMFIGGFGWAKPVPVNPNNFEKPRKGMAMTAAAGPLSNLIVAFLAMIIFQFVNAYGMNHGMAYYADGAIRYSQQNGVFYLIYILFFFVQINIGLALFNLIPVPPLDGSRIVSYYTDKIDNIFGRNPMVASIVFVVLICTGVLSRPLNFLSSHLFDLFDFLTGWAGIIAQNIF